MRCWVGKDVGNLRHAVGNFHAVGNVHAIGILRHALRGWQGREPRVVAHLGRVRRHLPPVRSAVSRNRDFMEDVHSTGVPRS